MKSGHQYNNKETRQCEQATHQIMLGLLDKLELLCQDVFPNEKQLRLFNSTAEKYRDQLLGGLRPRIYLKKKKNSTAETGKKNHLSYIL